MLLEKLKTASKELPHDRLLHLPMDGPSVNWKVLEMLDNRLNETKYWYLQPAYFAWCSPNCCSDCYLELG